MSSPPDSGPARPGHRELGTVRWFDVRRGFGFIAREAAVDVFVHASAVAAPRPLVPGDRVVFEVVDAPRGLQAREVRLADRPAAADGTSAEPRA